MQQQRRGDVAGPRPSHSITIHYREITAMARSAEGRLVPRHDPETVLDAAGNVVRVERRAIARAKGADVTPAAPADPAWHRLEELAGRVRRLTVLRNNPHSFFEERSEIAHQLARLADELKAEG